MLVAVGSENPVKIESVRLAFQKIWPETVWVVQGVAVPSGVSDQPMSDAESIQGARNRAIACGKQLGAAYGVGLEGGIQQIGEQYFECGWMVIIDATGKKVSGRR